MDQLERLLANNPDLQLVEAAPKRRGGSGKKRGRPRPASQPELALVEVVECLAEHLPYSYFVPIVRERVTAGWWERLQNGR